MMLGLHRILPNNNISDYGTRTTLQCSKIYNNCNSRPIDSYPAIHIASTDCILLYISLLCKVLRSTTYGLQEITAWGAL